MKLILLFLTTLLFSAALTFAFTLPIEKSKKTVTPLSVSHFSMEDAPRDSLKGFTNSFSGEVYWLSRIATEPAALKFQREVQQGENIITKEAGNAEIRFNGALSVTVLPYSEVAVIQTLPANLVMKQIAGAVEYTKLGNVPISIQIADLLINVEQGIVEVSADADGSEITVNVENGFTKVAYIDADEKSIISAVTAGNAFIYDAALETGSVRSIR